MVDHIEDVKQWIKRNLLLPLAEREVISIGVHSTDNKWMDFLQWVNDNYGQKWIAIKNSDGSIELVSGENQNYCLDLYSSRTVNGNNVDIYERKFGRIVGNKIAVSGTDKAGKTKTYLLTSHRFAGKKTIDMIKSSAESSIKLIKKSLFSQFGDEVSKKSKELLYLNSKLANVSESASGWAALKPKK